MLETYVPLSQQCNIAHPPRRSFRKRKERGTLEVTDQGPRHLSVTNTLALHDANHEQHAEMFSKLLDIRQLDPTWPVARVALRCRRIQLCLSCEELAAMTGTDSEFIQQLEIGDRVAYHAMWERIANCIGSHV